MFLLKRFLVFFVIFNFYVCVHFMDSFSPDAILWYFIIPDINGIPSITTCSKLVSLGTVQNCFSKKRGVVLEPGSVNSLFWLRTHAAPRFCTVCVIFESYLFYLLIYIFFIFRIPYIHILRLKHILLLKKKACICQAGHAF